MGLVGRVLLAILKDPRVIAQALILVGEYAVGVIRRKKKPKDD